MKKQKPLIGISSCLLGNQVRFDGGHKHYHWLTQELEKHVTWFPVCPEMEMGLGTPRESMRLEKPNPRSSVLLISNQNKVNLTNLAKNTCESLAQNLPTDLDGFIFKNRSPSCGLERVKIYGPSGPPSMKGVGFFAREFKKQFPLLPCVEEGHLEDEGLREHFVIRLFTLFHVKNLPAKVSEIQTFHQNYKFLIMSFHEPGMRALGRIAANSKKEKPSIVYQKYITTLSRVLKNTTTVKKRTNVIQHIYGFLKKKGTQKEKQNILNLIEQFRTEKMPFISLLTLLNHIAQAHNQSYIEDQVLFQPYPKSLKVK